MENGNDQLRLTLEEIERLIGDAGRVGLPLEGWLEQIAVELRAAVPEEAEQRDEGSAHIAVRILSDPRASLGAQAHLGPAVLRVLKD